MGELRGLWAAVSEIDWLAVKLRVLIIKLSSLGDLFHILPAVHCLKLGLNAEVDWATQSQYVDLVKTFTDIDRVIPFHRNRFFRKLPALIKDLRESEYDSIFDFQGLLKSAVVARIAKGKARLGPSYHREGARLFYSAAAAGARDNRHAVDKAMDIVRHMKLPLLEPSFPIQFPVQNLDAPRPRVALAPFSRWPSKNWPARFFVELGKDLREQAGASIYLIGATEEASACSVMAGAIPAQNMAGKLSLPELGGFLKEMDLVISNDSGPLHMAAAAGARSLAIFGPTAPDLTGPFGKRHEILRAELDCQPCFSKRCKFGDTSCLSVISPAAAAKTAVRMLSEPQS